MTADLESFDITVRQRMSTYVTTPVYGQKASCTAGPRQAAERLAAKLFQTYTVTELTKTVSAAHDESFWRIQEARQLA